MYRSCVPVASARVSAITGAWREVDATERLQIHQCPVVGFHDETDVEQSCSVGRNQYPVSAGPAAHSAVQSALKPAVEQFDNHASPRWAGSDNEWFGHFYFGPGQLVQPQCSAFTLVLTKVGRR